MKRIIFAVLLCTQLSGCFFILVPLAPIRAALAGQRPEQPVAPGANGPCLSTAYSAGNCKEGT